MYNVLSTKIFMIETIIIISLLLFTFIFSRKVGQSRGIEDADDLDDYLADFEKKDGMDDK